MVLKERLGGEAYTLAGWHELVVVDGQKHGVIRDLLHVVGELAKAEPWVDKQAHDDDEKPKGWSLDHDQSPCGAGSVCLGPDEDARLRDDDANGCIPCVAMSPFPLVVVLGADRRVGQTDEDEEDEEHDRNGDSKSVENAFRSVVVGEEESSEADVPQQSADSTSRVDAAVAVDLGCMTADGKRPRERDGNHDAEEHVDEVLVAGE